VNNLIDSDDFLELVDTTLYQQGTLSLALTKYNSTRMESNLNQDN